MKKRSILKCIIVFVLITGLFIFIKLLIYRKDINNNQKMIFQCTQQTEYYYTEKNRPEKIQDIYKIKDNEKAIYNRNSCYCKMFDLLLSKMLVYKVQAEGQKLDFVRLTQDSCIIIPYILFKISDAYIEYVSASDNLSFEEKIQELYKKTVYVYNSSLGAKLETENSFIKVSNKCLIEKNEKTNNEIKNNNKYTFERAIEEDNLTDKKFFIRIDLSLINEKILSDILDYSDNITGLILFAPCESSKDLVALKNYLTKIEKDFVLVSRKGTLYVDCVTDCKCKYMGKNIPVCVDLTLINKKFIDKKSLSYQQSYPLVYDFDAPLGDYILIPDYDINWTVILYEKIKQFFKKD